MVFIGEMAKSTMLCSILVFEAYHINVIAQRTGMWPIP